MAPPKHPYPYQPKALFLKPNSLLSFLFQHSQTHHVLEELSRQLIPIDARQHCRLASFNAGTLTFIIDNAAWATRLRFQEPNLLKNLKKHNTFKDLSKIRWIIRPSRYLTIPEPHPIKLSKNSAANILSSSEQIEYKPLREALQKLAQHSL